jgi:hypothetical protein
MMSLWSSYSPIRFMLPDSADGDGVPVDSSIKEAMRISLGGNVGIGTESPGAPLHIQFSDNTGGVGGLLIKNTNTGTTANFASISTQAENGTIQGTFGSSYYPAWGNRSVFAGSQTAHPFKILTGNAVRATFDTSGNVGIGTTPDTGWNSNFDVLQIGTAGVLYGYHANSQEVMCVGNNFNNVGASFVTADRINEGYAQQYLQDHGGYHVFRTTSSAAANSSITWVDAMCIDPDGKVGIGVTDPDAKLEVKGTSAAYSATSQILSVTNTTGGTRLDLGVLENSNGWIQAREGSTARNLLLNSAGGNVGIGTTAPGHKLSIGPSASAIHLGYNGTAASTEVGRITSNTYDVDNTSYSLAEMTYNTSSANGYTGNIQFRTNSVNSTNTRAAVRMTIDDDGLKFGADTAAANALDDYEEGTWTVTDQSGAGMSLTVYVATYTKIGNQVFFEIGMVFPTTSSTAGIALSLPYAVKNSSDNTGGAVITTTNSGRNDSVVVGRNTTLLYVASNLNVAATNNDYSGKQLRCAGQYTTQ